MIPAIYQFPADKFELVKQAQAPIDMECLKCEGKAFNLLVADEPPRFLISCQQCEIAVLELPLVIK